MQVDRVLDALGDPSRRAVLERLRAGPLAVGELADGLPISRPAVSQHLRVLGEAGLVQHRAEGTRRVYRVRPEGLAAVRDYLDRFWDTALVGFAALAEVEARTEEPAPTDDERRPR